MIVAFRSAKERNFPGAKDDYWTLFDRAISVANRR